MADRLDSKTIVKVASLLTWESVCKIAVEYMSFDLQELENIWQKNMPHVISAIEEVLRTFVSKSNGKDEKQVTMILFL